jgi:hypothetical protein
MLVAACTFGKITSEDDDLEYTKTKQQFIDLILKD